MSPQRFKSHLEAEPFVPFTIVKGDGQEVDVLSRDLVLVYPGGRTAHVVAPRVPNAKDEADFEDHYLDVFLVTDIVKPARRRGRSTRSQRKSR
jgi:hypothetical protein